MSIEPIRWFDSLPTCRCGKPSHGWLMTFRNDKFAASCTKCATARLKKVKADEAALAKAWERAGR